MLNIEKENVVKYIYYFLISLLFFYSIELISQVIIYQIDEFKVDVVLFTDLRAHIHFAITNDSNYSLLYELFGLIYTIFPHKVSIAVFILIIISVTIYMAGRYLYKNTNLNNFSLCVVLALFAYIEVAIYIPALSPSKWYAFYMSGLWHNSTLIGLKLMSLIMLILFQSIATKINTKKSVPVREFIIFSLVAMVGAHIKPNLVFFMYPALGIMIIIWFFKDKKLFKQLVYLSLTIIPTLVVLLIQAKILFPNRVDEALAIIPFYHMNYHYNVYHYPTIMMFILMIFQCFLFPLVALPLLWKHIKEMGNYTFVWICTLIALFEADFIVELGERQWHGNWRWGVYASIFLLFLVTIEYLIKNTKEIWRKGIGYKLWIILCYFLLLLYAVNGYKYMLRYISL